MMDMSTNDSGGVTQHGPILIGYDGSALAALAIERAGREITTDRDAIVLCVWQPADVGFASIDKRRFDANCAAEVRQAAEETAEFGAELARKAGFRAQSLTLEAAPTWKGIVKTAEEHQVDLIVLGAHQHAGFVGHLLGSVTAAVLSHTTRPVLVVHKES
jgi:nucleotide-binding universal stress UspA family protein